MSELVLGGLLILALVFFVLLGTHIAVALTAIGFAGVWLMREDLQMAMRLLYLSAYNGVADYIFATIPLFVLMGLLVSIANVGKDTFDVAEALLRRIRGGLGVATVLANTVFAAVTGVSIASAAVFTRVAVPEMVRHGYRTGFAAGTVAGSSVLGMMIPPSLLLIIYGVLAEQSIGKLFIAGLIPGLLMATAFAVMIMVMARFSPSLVFDLQRQAGLARRREIDRHLSRGEMLSKLTPIAGAIKAARRAVGGDGTAQRLIRTVHGRGFSFAGTVVAMGGDTTVGDSARVDAQIPTSPNQTGAGADRGAAVLSADVHLCELINGDAPAASAESQLLSHRAALRGLLEGSGGRILAASGGGMAARFDRAEDALQCAASLQRWGPPVELAASAKQPARLRIGVCDLGTDFDRAIGTAGRLQCLASPGEICVTGSIEQAVRDRHGFVGSPVAGDLDSGLNDLRLSIIHSRQLPQGADRGGAAQLQCGAPIQPRVPSVVILPFQAIGHDELTTELAEGLRIDVQNGLVKISRILLIAAGSANAFRGKTPEDAARSLGVRYVLHGVVQIVKARARVSLELIDTLSTQAVWSEQFNPALDDAFAIQDDITGKVIAALDAKLYSGEQARIWQQVLTDPKIVRVFYRGVRLFFRMDRAAMTEAIRAFESVAEMRPTSSVGATWVALCHWIEHLRGWRDPPSESRRLAKQWADVAVRQPDADGQAHTVLAHVHLLDREFDAALLAGRQALEIRPGCANANGFFGQVLHYCGEQDEAITRIKRGIRLQPVYPPFFACMLATAYLASCQPETALVVAKEALRINSRDIAARLILVAAARTVGADRLSDIFASEVLRLEPAFSISAYRAGQPYRDATVVDGLARAWLAAGLSA